MGFAAMTGTSAGSERAISLYQRFGFAIEGTMPRYVFLGGAFCDAHLMGRLRG